jgi:hypothetical protein
MTWVIWRQHRTQAIACLVLLVVLAAFTIAAGTWMRATFNADGLPACLAHSGGARCPAAITSFVNEFSHNTIGTVADLPLLAISGLLGLAVGAPLLGQELERGTWRLAWSQTVPRTRWLATKLGFVTGGLVLFGVAVTLLMTWYHGPLDQVTPRAGPFPFDGEGLTFIASLLCSFGLWVLAGLLFRNVIGAVAIPQHDPLRGHARNDLFYMLDRRQRPRQRRDRPRIQGVILGFQRPAGPLPRSPQ